MRPLTSTEEELCRNEVPLEVGTLGLSEPRLLSPAFSNTAYPPSVTCTVHTEERVPSFGDEVSGPSFLVWVPGNLFRFGVLHLPYPFLLLFVENRPRWECRTWRPYSESHGVPYSPVLITSRMGRGCDQWKKYNRLGSY